MDKQHSVLHMRTSPTPSIATSALRWQPDVSTNLYLRSEKVGDVETTLDVLKEHPVLVDMSAEGRRDYLAAEIHAARKRRDLKIERSLKDHEAKLAELDLEKESLDDLIKWLTPGTLNLERPQEVSFRKIRRACHEGPPIGMRSPASRENPHDWEKEIFCKAEVLLVEHNWSAALQGAAVEDAQYNLPFEVCAFEFRISGRSVVAFAVQADSEIIFTLVIDTKAGWYFMGNTLSAKGSDDKVDELYGIVISQIRSICIALDAEVAEAEITREPYTRAAGKNHHGALRTYHVVKLARRVAHSLPLNSEPTGRRVRLHFRRGHWRHFDTHKTWIKWMLVGDPDLGFIEKHYKC